MSNYKNRIITISGDPSSGKSTVIKKLKEDYEKQGYRVHIYSVGHAFRKIAEEKGLTIEELNKYMAERSEIDELIDSTVAQRGEEIDTQERPKDVYIFDSRLAFHNIPNSFSIRLTIDDNTAGQRAFNDPTRDYKTIEEATQKTKERKLDEVERYGERYGVDLQDIENYKLVIDTSYSSIEDIAKEIQKCLELELEGKEYAKMRVSQKMILPSQAERVTLGKSPESGLDLDQWQEKLKTEGYDLTQPVKVIKVDGMIMCVNGMHRVIASHRNGESLIACEVVAKDDEIIPECGGTTAREYFESHLSTQRLNGHAWHFDTQNEDGKTNYFSYDEVYPGLTARVKAKEGEQR